MTTTVSERKPRYLIKESMKEALDTGLMKLRALVLPDVSEKEQKDIERRYGRARLYQLMQIGAIRRAKRDLELAKDWFNVEEGVWPKASKK